jgi:hypothetical protein
VIAAPVGHDAPSFAGGDAAIGGFRDRQRRVFESASLETESIYCDKKSYPDSIIICSNCMFLDKRIGALNHRKTGSVDAFPPRVDIRA